jgi:hypothetical protein
MCKWAVAVAPGVIKDNAAFVASEIDTKGFSHCAIAIQVGATDVTMAVLKVQESDTSGSGFADVTGLIFGTSTNVAGDTSALPTSTDDNDIFVFEIDLRPRKRYLKVGATAGDGTSGTYLSGMALLQRAAIGPSAAADWGANQVLRV